MMTMKQQQRRPSLRSPSLVFAVVAICAGSTASALIIYPAGNGRIGGTLVDGGLYGPYDGVADEWDWTFNGYGGYEGVLTLMHGASSYRLDQRVVWEYDLSALPTDEALGAILYFNVRGAPIFPFPEMTVHVYSYPADLQESSDDFGAGPAKLVTTVKVPPYQESSFQLNVTEAVVDAVRNGGGRLALRFQIAPESPHDANQAFMDIDDSDNTTKPTLMTPTVAYGDDNADGAIDLTDYAGFPFCLLGPGQQASSDCRVFDFDVDGDVDAVDAAWFANMQTLFSSQ